MSEFTFQHFNALCKLNTTKKYVNECIHILENEDCIFHSGIIMPHDDVSSLYQLRLDIAKEEGEFSDEYLRDFQDCVANLEKSKSKNLSITTFYGNENAYLTFFEPINQVVLGILKSDNSDIKTLENREKDMISRGFSSDAEKYSKGILVKNWI